MQSIESFDIEDKLIEFLSIHHDKAFTIQQIHSEFYEKYDIFRNFELKKTLIEKLKVAFLTIEGNYNNVYRFVKDDKHYLIWTLRSKDEIIKETLNYDKNVVIVDKEIEHDLNNLLSFSNNTDYYVLVKQMVADRNFGIMYDKNYIDGTNHPIHILILNNDLESIKKLMDLTIIDFGTKNKDGKDCLEIARDVKNCEILETILQDIYESKMKNFIKINESLKETQKKNYDEITNLTKQNTDLKKDLDSIISDRESASKMVNFLFFFILILSFYIGLNLMK